MLNVKVTPKLMSLICLITVLLWWIPLKAAEQDFYSTDVFVLMDSSNSIFSKDPEGLRFKAFENMAGQLLTGDRIGLFQFGYEAKLVYPLTEIDSSRKDGILSLAEITKENMVYTDVKRVLNDSYQEMLKSFDSEHFPFFIMLTDGSIQPTSNFNKDASFKKEYIEELKSIAQKYKDKNWPLYVVNIGKNDKSIDPDLIDICKLTGGYALNIDSPEALNGAFEGLLKEIRKVKESKAETAQKSISNREEPELAVTSPEAGQYRISGNIDIHTEIRLGGRRLKSNTDTDFIVKEFYVSVENAKGAETRLELKDDGAVVNGDTRKNDGIYSASLKPDCEGNLKLVAYMAAEYKGASYSLRRDIKGIEISPSGLIEVSFSQPGTLDLARGKKNYVELKLKCNSENPESVVFTAQQSDGITLGDTTFYLKSQNNTKIRLELAVDKKLPAGKQGNIIIKLTSANSNTNITPASLNLNYKIVNKSGLLILLFIFVPLLQIMVILIVFKHKKKSASLNNVKGVLLCWRDYDSSNIRKIKLDDFKKDRLHISSVYEEKVDIVLDVPEDIDFEIYSEQYKSETLYFVTAGINNIINASSVPSKTLKLTDGISFEIKTCRFSYSNPNIKDEKGKGTNILEKYDI